MDVVDGGGQERLLGGKEHAHVAGRWVDRAEDGEHEEGPECRERGEGEAGHDHRDGDDLEQGAPPEVVAAKADEQGRGGRPEQGAGDEGADLHVGEADGQEVGGQDDGHEPVDERSGATAGEEEPSVARRPGREEPHGPPMRRVWPRSEALVVLLVGDGLAPLGRTLHVDGDVRHRRVGAGTVEVPALAVDVDDVAGLQHVALLAPRPHPALAGDGEQELAARVSVPVGPRRGREVDDADVGATASARVGRNQTSPVKFCSFPRPKVPSPAGATSMRAPYL